MDIKTGAVVRDMGGPMLRRPEGLQVAALCHRTTKAKLQVLLITSRGTGRWIIPKGWPIRGLGLAEAAVQEAWEEAGVINPRVAAKAIGRYSYVKTMQSGLPRPIQTLVYSAAVDQMANSFPESHERQRKWASPQEAATLVDEPELKAILHGFGGLRSLGTQGGC